MPPSASKANYKTYEAQARMVRAIVAAHPEVKWNYKEIVGCYGSDMTDNALQHRFRRLRAQSTIIREARLQNLDMKNMERDDNNLPNTIDGVDKQNIAKYFGQSTPDGIQFQFRTIKKDAEQLRKTAKEGGSVAKCLDLPSSTPGSANTTPKTPRSRAVAKTPTTAGKRRNTPTIKRSESDLEGASDEDDSTDNKDWSGLDETPSKRPKMTTTSVSPGQKNGLPSRLAATRAGATIADASAQFQSSDSSHDELETPKHSLAAPRPQQQHSANTIQPSSIFGNGSQSKTTVHGNTNGTHTAHAASLQNTAFSGTGRDAYFGGEAAGDPSALYSTVSHDLLYGDDIDGEI